MTRYLFPHKVQKISMLVFLIDILVMCAILSYGVHHQPIGMKIESVLVIIMYLSIFVCVFSKEKIEDEFISSLRLKSLAIVSFLGFAFIIILDIVHVLLPYEGFLAMKEWRIDHFWNGNYYVDLAILYFIILKISIKANNR